MNVKEIVDKTVKKYHSRCPYELSKLLDINIVRCELGEIRGYYCKIYRIKQIFLNCNLTRDKERFVLAHEIGHSILHPDANTPFLKENSFLSVDKLEIEANKFAIELLLSDEILNTHRDYSIEQLSRLLGYNEKLIELRLNNYFKKG